MIRYSRMVAALGAAALGLLVVAASPSEPAYEPQRVVAAFEGGTLDLSADWGEARACLVWDEAVDVPECFRTEAEMNARIVQLEEALNLSPASALLDSGGVLLASSDCSGYLRLYDGTGYTGAVLYLRGRFQWHNLADYGFDQRTSSYRIGPCSAYFADYADGGGSWYPTSLTEAYDSASSMTSGWDNDVSSVYIT